MSPSPPPEVRTSQEELLGTTTGIIVTAVVAVIALAMLLMPVFLAARTPNARPRGMKRRQEEATRGRQAGGGGQAGEGTTAGSAGGQGHWPSERLEDRDIHGRGSPHGRPSSWALVAVMVAAFLTGGLAIIAHAWWLMWTCAGIFLLGVPAGKAIGIMNDTVSWGSTPAAGDDRPGDHTALPQDQPRPAPSAATRSR